MWTNRPDGGCFAPMGTVVLQVAPCGARWRWFVAVDQRGGVPLRGGWAGSRLEAQRCATQAAEALQAAESGSGE